jgi:ABC-type transporter Mla subunit MlaD
MRRKTWIVIAVAVVVVAAVALALWLTLGQSRTSSKTSVPTQGTVVVTRGDISNTLVVYGRVVSKQ